MRRLALAGLVLLCAGASNARGAAVLSSWEFSADGLGDFHLQGQLNRFQPALGTLRQVCLGLTGEAGVSVEFNRSGAATTHQLFLSTAKIHGGALGMVGDSTTRSFVDVPTSPQRGSQSADSQISSRAEFTADEWREFLTGFGSGNTIDFDVDGSLQVSVNGATTYDHDVAGQPLANELRGRFFVKYVFDTPIEGDTNGDGAVNLTDFGMVKSAFGATGDDADVGDLTGDGIVDLNDFGRLKMAMASRSGAAAVPEPATFALVLAGLSALLAAAVARRCGH